MEKNLYLKIDDDVARAVNKISKERATEITLILPKESWVLADLINLKLLKKHTDALGKRVSILTMDKEGQKLAREVGFELKNTDVLRHPGVSMDVITRKPRQPAWQALYPKKSTSREAKVEKVAPELKAPEIAPVVMPDPVQEQPAPIIEQQPLYQQAAAEVPDVGPVVAAPAVVQEIKREAKLIPKKLTRKQDNYLPRKPSYKRGLAFLFTSILIAAVVLGTVILPQADITVFAHSQPIARDMQVALDQNAKSADTKNLVLPAKVFEDKSQSISQVFPSTGTLNVGIAARGAVQIYNFTGKTLKFGAGTTKFTVGKKTYHLEKDATGIKATKKFQNGDVDPKSLTPEVNIIADQPGDDYNFPGGTRLEVQNDILGSVPELIYAQSNKPIAGGVSRYTNIVSQEDLDKASKNLSDTILNRTKAKILQEQGLTLIDSGANVAVAGIGFDKKAGDTTLNFTGTITASVKALVFNMEDLQKMVRERVSLTLDNGKYLAGDQDLNFKIDFKNVDLNLGTGLLTVSYSGKVISDIDDKEIGSKIRGKSPSDVKEILLSNPDIDGVELTLKPFWVTKVPNLFGKVHVNVEVK